MRKIHFILFLIFITIKLQAQLVTTVAGQIGIAGGADGAAFDATFNNPHGIAINNDGIVYVTDRWSHTIRKIDLDGTVSTLAGLPGVAGDADGDNSIATFNEPWGLCVNSQGNILVADTRNNKIRKITPEGIVSTIAGSGSFGSYNALGITATFGNPTGIESDEFGNIYVADHLTHIIRKIDPLGFVTTIAGKASQDGDADGQGNQALFYRPYGLTLDHDGNILVADEWNHKIKRVTPEGLVTTIAGTGDLGSEDSSALSSSFNFPWDITVDSLGNIFVADGYNYLIRKISPNGQVLTYAGTVEVTGATDGEGTEATFSGATAIAFSPVSQELYVGDAYNNLVRKITDLGLGVAIKIASGDPTICLGENISINAYPNVYDVYNFYINNEVVQSGSSPTFESNQLILGNHIVQVLATNIGGTSTSNELMIQVVEAEIPTITTDGATTFYEGDSVILISSDGADYFWSTGETTATISVSTSGNYTVEVEDQNGCIGISDPIEVIVEIDTTSNPGNGGTGNPNPPNDLDNTIDVFIPTAFTPNGDGENDILFVRGENIQEINMMIFNQWGEMVFQSSSMDYGWDGKVENQNAQIGNYVFSVEYINGNGNQKKHSGHLTLLR